MYKFVLSALLVALTLFTVSCSEDDNGTGPETMSLNLINSYQENNFNVEIFSYSTELKEGYSELYISIKDNDGNSISEFFDSNLMMDMMMGDGMQHSTPYTIDDVTIDGKEYLKISAIFVMPTVEMGTWYVELTDDRDNELYRFEIEVGVTNLVSSFKTDNISYFVCLVEPMNPEVGLNDITFAVFERDMNMNYSPSEELSLDMEPTMPYIGHGSSGNVNPE